MRAALICLFLFVASLGSQISMAHAQSGQCSNAMGQIFSFGPAQNFPGALVIQLVDFPEQFVMVGPVAHPVVAYANVDWAGNGTLLLHNGGLVAVWYGRNTTIAQCILVQPLAPQMPSPSISPSVMQPLPAYGAPSVGQQIVAQDPTGRETIFPQPDGALPMLLNEQQARTCVNENGDNHDAFLGCMVDSMTNAKQREILHCVQDNDNAIDGGACLANAVDPRAGRIVDTLSTCGAIDGDTDWDCLARNNLDGRMLSAYECVADDQTDVSDCLDALGADARTRRAAQIVQRCYDSDVSDYALCALQQSDSRDVARAASCIKQQVESADPSYLGAGICFATGALNLNPEQRIAIDCAVSTGGQPYAFAACAGGRLTARELTKCFTAGVGGNGCFGPNNEIVKALSLAGIDVNNLTNPNGEVIRAWNTVSNDLRNGPGSNNDVVRTLNQVQNTVTSSLNNVRRDLTEGPGANNEIVKFAENAARDITQGPGPNNEIRKAVCGLFNC